MPVYGFLCVRVAQPFFGGSTLEQLLHTQPQQLVAGIRSGRVAHSMSLVTPNTNTLNVNNEVTHGTAAYGTEHGNGCGSGVTVIVLPLLPCPALPCHELRQQAPAPAPAQGRRTDPTRPGCAASPLLTFDTVTAFSDLFHVDMRRCHDNQRQPAPCTCSP